MKVEKVKVKGKAISHEGRFVAQKDVFDRTTVTPRAKANWITDHQLYINDGYVYTPITIGYKLFWMAAITGSIYDNNGDCKSGSKSIDIRHMYKDDDKAKKILMSNPVI